MITLHPHQNDTIAAVRAALNSGPDVCSVLIVAPTGFGKTVLAAWLAHKVSSNGKRVTFVVHRQELIRQSVKAFKEFGIDPGVIASDHAPEPDKLVHVAMVGTLARRIDKYPAPDLMIVDEAHHCPASQYRKVMAAKGKAKILGMTATPERLDGKGLGRQFQRLVEGPTVEWLIRERFLSNFRAFSPPGVDTKSLAVHLGDFVHADTAEAMDKPTITGDAIRHYQQHATGKRMIAFCAGVKHSKNVAESYRNAGITAEHVDGDTQPAEREAIIKRFETGETLVLCNVALFGEGFDVPAATAVQLLRPTLSLALHLQQIGRALRYVAGKTAIILDHVGGIARHGLPDKPRIWSLEGRKAVKSKPETEVEEPDVFAVQCSSCYEWIKPARSCPHCGREMPVDVRKRFLKVVPGKLIEVYRQQLMEDATCSDREEILLATRTEAEAEIRAGQAQEKAAALARLPYVRTQKECHEIARVAGYKPGWAYWKWQEIVRRHYKTLKEGPENQNAS